MPTTLTITVRYADGSVEVFTNCVIANDTDAKIEFTGSLAGGPATETHKILLGPGMRVSKKQV
jgi:hypothetical protein